MLKGSWRLGSLFGIPVFVHWTFLLLLAFFMAGPLLGGGADAVANSVRTGAFVLAIFGCVLLHEFGHALAARRFGVGTRDITLLPIGGVARLERMPEKPVQELIVALAGPAVNVVIAAIVIPIVLATDGVQAFTGGAAAAASTGPASAGVAAGTESAAKAVEMTALHHTNFLAALGVVNVFLVVFNMIPALPMDGGRVLRSLLAMVMERRRATAAAATLGQLVAIAFAVLGIFSGNILLFVIAAFVFLGAAGEAHAEQFRSALEGLPVRAAMITRFTTLRASQTLRDAATELLAGTQQEFPVLADGAADDDASAVVGVLTRGALVRGVAGGQWDQPISEVMAPPCPFVREHEDLRAALDRRASSGRDGPSGASEVASEPIASCPLIGVVRDDPLRPGRPRLVGIITPENLTELVMLRSAAIEARR